MPQEKSQEIKHFISPNVRLGSNCELGFWVELGHVPKGRQEDILELVIGNDAVIRSRSVIYAGTKIGNNFSTGHGAIIHGFVTIGDNVSVGSGSEIFKNCVIGSNVRIHSQCFIPEGTVIEDNVRIAPGTVMADAKHPLLPEDKKTREGPRIKQGAYLGVGVKVLPHVVIGAGSLVGAGSVVTKDVPDGVVVFGSPAKVYMSVKEYMARLI